MIDLTTFFLSISSAAFMGLGSDIPGTPDDQNSGKMIDLDLAKQNIDLLELMQEKTKGNRTKEEEDLLIKLLTEVRLKYVEAKDRSATK